MRLRIEAANAAIAVIDGLIADPIIAVDHVIRIPDGVLRPGLINAHDHLRLNHFGRLGAPPYANAYDWARDIQARYPDIIAAGRKLPRRQALLRGAWRNLLAGVTHVMHHDVWEADFERGFPLTVMRLPLADSLGMTPDLAPPPDASFALHLAEGTDTAAAEEVRILDHAGLLHHRLVAVHGVGADADGVVRLRRAGAALCWCPSSNHFLFGRTAPAALLAEGMAVLLGTDSLLTGVGDLLDELRFARALDLVSDARLLEAVGGVAAARLGLAAPSLAPGTQANIAIFRRPVLDAETADVALVMAGGALRVLDPRLLPDAIRHGRIHAQGRVQRWIDDGDTPPQAGRAP